MSSVANEMADSLVNTMCRRQRILWSVTLTIAAFLFVVQVFSSVSSYLAYEIDVKIGKQTASTQQFPAVTVCNINKLRRSAVAVSEFRGIMALDGPLKWFEKYARYSGPCIEGDITCDNNQCVKGFMESGLCNGDVVSADVSSCPADWTICDSQCIPPAALCNYINDCDDGSDESNCPYNNGQCPEDAFECNDVQMKCIPKTKTCDRVKHCNNGNDEQNCAYTEENVFMDDWNKKFLGISSDPSIYEDFRYNFYVNKTFTFLPNMEELRWVPLMVASQAADFADLKELMQLTKGDIQLLGHQAEQFIMKCEFNGLKCDISDFRVMQDNVYGNCFTFNGNAVHQSARSGPNTGLKLLLNIEQEEQMSLFGRNSGTRLQIHSPEETPFPSQDGIDLKPGMSTGVAFDTVAVERLPLPYGDCYDTAYPENDGNYSAKICEEKCFQNHLLDKCGCVTSVVLDGETMCSALDEHQDMCVQMMTHFRNNGNLFCRCPPPCRERDYKITTSDSNWPSKVYMEHFARYVKTVNDDNEDMDEDRIRENIVSVNVYMSDMSTMVFVEVPSFTLVQMLADLLAAFGGWIGMAVFINVIANMCWSRKVRTHVGGSPSSQPI